MNKMILIAIGFGQISLAGLLIIFSFKPVQQAPEDLQQAQFFGQTDVAAVSAPVASNALVGTLCGVALASSGLFSLWKGFAPDSEEEYQQYPQVPYSHPIANHVVPQQKRPIGQTVAPSHPSVDRQKISTPVKPEPIEVPIGGLRQTFLSHPKYKALHFLLDSGCVRLWGGKGSAKTTLSAAIIREKISEGWTVWIFNQHLQYGMYDPLPPGEKGIETSCVWGHGDTAEEQFEHISLGIRLLLEEDKDRYRTQRTRPKSEWDFLGRPILAVFEEVGEYAGNIDDKLRKSLFKAILISWRKSNISALFTSQGVTKEMFGDVGGIKDALENQLTDLHLFNKPDPNAIGGFSPTLTGVLTINKEHIYDVHVPPLPLLMPGVPDGQEFDFNDLLEVEEMGEDEESEPITSAGIPDALSVKEREELNRRLRGND